MGFHLFVLLQEATLQTKPLDATVGRLLPDKQTMSEFPRIAELVWKQRQGDADATARNLAARLDEQKRLKSELLRAKLRGEVRQSDYAQMNAEFDNEIGAIDEQLYSVRSNPVSLEAFLRFANAMLMDIAAAWKRAGSEQKLRVQDLLFQGGLQYSQESMEFEHPNPCLFNTMEEMTGKNWWLASPTGFEPVFTP